MTRGGAACRHCRWRSDATGYCLWPVCLHLRIDCGGHGENQAAAASGEAAAGQAPLPSKAAEDKTAAAAEKRKSA